MGDLTKTAKAMPSTKQISSRYVQHNADSDNHARSLLTHSNLLLQSVQYLGLQGQYQLILPPNGMQDRFLGHLWFVQMGLTLELPPQCHVALSPG